MEFWVKATVPKETNEDSCFSCHHADIHVCLCFRFKDTIVNAKYGGHTEAVRRLLGQLPISAQSYSSSPYLDLSLFSYDDKWVSVMERPKTCGDHPIRCRLYQGECASSPMMEHNHMINKTQQPSYLSPSTNCSKS